MQVKRKYLLVWRNSLYYTNIMCPREEESKLGYAQKQNKTHLKNIALVYILLYYHRSFYEKTALLCSQIKAWNSQSWEAA